MNKPEATQPRRLRGFICFVHNATDSIIAKDRIRIESSRMRKQYFEITGFKRSIKLNAAYMLFLCVGVVCVSLVTMKKNFWHDDVKPYVFTGYLQGDQPSYSAFAREVFERGNGITYANPMDYREDAPRVLSNGGYVLLGWLFKLTGGRQILAWEIWRTFWAICCFGLFGFLTFSLIRQTPVRNFAYLAGCFGGGMAWVWLLAEQGTAVFGRLNLEAIYRAEGGLTWWCTNLFRQSLYPLELYYHALLFLCLFLFLKRRYVLLCIVFALLWWSHVITALLASSVLLPLLLLECRDKDRWRERTAFIVMVCVVLAFVFYNKVYLQSFESIRLWTGQTLSFDFAFDLRLLPRVLGPFIIAPVFLLFPNRFSRYVYRSRGGRLTLVYFFATLAWSQNDLILEPAIQPLHFLRGHLFASAVLLTGIALERSRLHWRLFAYRSPRRGLIQACVAIVLIIIIFSDNMLFLGGAMQEIPQTGLLTITPQEDAMLEAMATLEGSRVVFTPMHKLGILIASETPHRPYIADTVITPDYTNRMQQALEALYRGGGQQAKALDIEWLLLPTNRLPAWTGDPEQFRVIKNDRGLVLGEIL